MPSDSPFRGRKTKRATSTDPEGEAPKKGKMALSDGSDSEFELVPKRPPRVKLSVSKPANLG